MTEIAGEILASDVRAAIAARSNRYSYNTCRECMLAHTLTRMGLERHWVSFSEVIMPNGDVFKIDGKTTNLIGQFIASGSNKELGEALIEDAPYKFTLTLRS